MQNFAAIDFEAANAQPTSVCSVGIVIVRDGEVADTFYSLIKPTPNYYHWYCSKVHGLRRHDTDQANIFPLVWQQVERRLEGLPMVAHNARYDEGCLKAVMRTYQMDYPDYQFFCTLQASQKIMKELPNHQLQTVAEACGFHLDHHHNALADAMACAAIAIKLL